jgi:O-acetyl-ADP-ribose deacetylase (regulator of RNase III)
MGIRDVRPPTWDHGRPLHAAGMSDERRFGSLTVRLVRGDIADQPDVDAIVNAANAQLETGGGVAGAVHAAAGPGLAREARAQAPIRPGEAVITAGHDLPNRHVIHVLGPVHGRDEPADEILAAGYRRALELAEREGLASVATPAISTGAFGYPVEEAARVAVGAVAAFAPEARSLHEVRFVLWSAGDLDAFRRALDATDDPSP